MALEKGNKLRFMERSSRAETGRAVVAWDAKIGRRVPFFSFPALSLGAVLTAICAPAAAAGRSVQALRTEAVIVLDGVLDEGAWRRVQRKLFSMKYTHLLSF
ncbi:MAG: hypothetical protein HYX74_02545 [Acidobacteria bacterium]|nr:hypothetical protein [Acidobacteriota bacterium]